MYIQDIDLKLKDWQYSQRKNLPYGAKLNLSETRIVDFYNHYQGQVYTSFSGGLDSTVMAHMIERMVGKIPKVFVDTGLEFPELVEFVKRQDDVVILKPEKPFVKIICDYGYPVVSKETAMKIRKLRNGNLSERYRNYLLYGDERGSIGKLAEKWKYLIDTDFDTSEKCCDYMKKKPFKQYNKTSGRVPFVGITQDEGKMRQRQYEKTGCNVYDAKDPISKPLGFWTKQDVLRYAFENEIEIASVYGRIEESNGTFRLTGEQRTGCMFCAFGAHLENQRDNRFTRMAETHPNLWGYCIRGGEMVEGKWRPKGGLGMGHVLDRIGVNYKPQMNFFNEIDECELRCED